MNSLERRYRWSIGVFIVGLVLSGVTAFPLLIELRLLSDWLGVHDLSNAHSDWRFQDWIVYVTAGLEETYAKFPFLGYGTDWLAFGHISIAVFFVRPWFRPLESDWVLRCGLICCAGVIPLALIAGPIRGIPFGWRLIDCSFGVVGSLPLFYCLHLTRLMRATK